MATEPGALRVLLVDDEEDILELLGEYLRVRGLPVQSSPDGEIAAEILASGRVDVLLCDVQLPGLGGFDLLKKATAVEPSVGVLLMTGFPTVDGVVRALREGADDFLCKPFRLRDVYEAVRRAGARVIARREAARNALVASFFEVAGGKLDPVLGGVLLTRLAALARAETGAREAAVWVPGARGWSRVAESGSLGALVALDPGSITEPRQGASGLAAVPLRAAGRGLVGVLAVAGGAARTAAQIDRLLGLARVTVSALSTLDRVVLPRPEAPERI